MSMIPFNIADNNLVFIGNGRPYNVAADHQNFVAIRDALLSASHSLDELISLADIPTAIHMTSGGKISIVNGEVFYKDNPLHNVWTEKLLRFFEQGIPFDPLLRSLESLMRNPSFMARQRLPLFQQHNDLGFMPDGRLTGLKAVRFNFMDKWAGRFNNAPGKICEMPREAISDNPGEHCAPGLHVGSWSYVANYADRDSDRIVLVAFWPEDVVAVPNDLQTKIRVSKYESLLELDRSAVDAFIEKNNLVVDTGNDDDLFDDDDDEEEQEQDEDSYGIYENHP